MNIIIIHGVGAGPESNWFPWLKEKLEELNCTVYIPQFSGPEEQSLDDWMKTFEDYKQYLNEETILVGHSLGVPFILSVLETINKPIKAAFLVAGCAKQVGIPEFDIINKTFLEKVFDWNKIKQNCKKFYVYNSDNDIYIPLELGKDLANKLGVKLIFCKGAGHFMEAERYITAEFLMDDLLNEIR